MNRAQIMSSFREELSQGWDNLTPDDRIEIFLQILLGSSDITMKLLTELFCDYGITNLHIMESISSNSGRYVILFGTDPNIGGTIELYDHKLEKYLFQLHSKPQVTFFIDNDFTMDVDDEEKLCEDKITLDERVSLLRKWLLEIVEDPAIE